MCHGLTSECDTSKLLLRREPGCHDICSSVQGGDKNVKRFRVTVNGNQYDVVVEEIQGGEMPKSEAAVASLASERASAAVHAPNGQDTAPAGKGTQVKAPLAGTILSVKVSVGSVVKRGDVLVTLEALKMENEIQAPVDGTVSYVGVSEGQNVEVGAVLVAIE